MPKVEKSDCKDAIEEKKMPDPDMCARLATAGLDPGDRAALLADLAGRRAEVEARAGRISARHIPILVALLAVLFPLYYTLLDDPDNIPGGWWAVLGAAAGLVAAAVGLLIAASTRSDDKAQASYAAWARAIELAATPDHATTVAPSATVGEPPRTERTQGAALT